MKILTEASIARTDNLNAKIPKGMTYHIKRKLKRIYKKGKHKIFEERQSKTRDIQRRTSRKATF